MASRGKVIALVQRGKHPGAYRLSSREVIFLCSGAAYKSAGKSCLDIQVLAIAVGYHVNHYPPF